MNRILPILAIFVIAFSSCGRKKSGSYTVNRFEDEKQLEIAKLQDLKDGKGLKKFINAKKETHRYRACLAYSSVKDTNAIPYLSLRLQTDRIARVRAAAAYSLGQIGHKTASPALIEGIGIEFEPWVRAIMIEALGKIPSSDNLDLILSLKSKDSLTDEGILAGLYQLVLRNKADERVYYKAMHALDSGARNTHFYAAHILARGNFKIQPDSLALPTFWDIYDHCQVEQAKIALAIAAGGFDFDSASRDLVVAQQNAILSRILIEKNHLLRANLVRSLSKTGVIRVQPGDNHKVHELIKEVHPQVLFAIRESLLPANKEVARFWFEKQAFLKGSAEYYKLLEMRMKFDPKLIDGASTNAKLQHDFQEVKTSYQALPMLKTMAADPANFDFIFEVAKNSKIPYVRTAAIGALNNIVELKYEKLCECETELKKYHLEVIPYALRSGDVGMISQVNYTMQQKWFVETTAEIKELLDSVSRSLKLPLEMETYIDVKKTLAKLEKKPFKKPKPIYAHPVKWEEVLKIQDTTRVLIKTNKGDIVVDCYVNEAPGTVWNFLKLVDSGYFNGKSFHRLVPSFVIQGGCDRGDGWGSPNWSQRSEFSNFLKYEEGSVGIASVGQDTEGFQFFLTHNATPHLTGRYTIFAKATNGLPVVQSLDVGDKILSISRIKAD